MFFSFAAYNIGIILYFSLLVCLVVIHIAIEILEILIYPIAAIICFLAQLRISKARPAITAYCHFFQEILN